MYYAKTTNMKKLLLPLIILVMYACSSDKDPLGLGGSGQGAENLLGYWQFSYCEPLEVEAQANVDKIMASMRKYQYVDFEFFKEGKGIRWEEERGQMYGDSIKYWVKNNVLYINFSDGSINDEDTYVHPFSVSNNEMALVDTTQEFLEDVQWSFPSSNVTKASAKFFFQKR